MFDGGLGEVRQSARRVEKLGGQGDEVVIA